MPGSRFNEQGPSGCHAGHPLCRCRLRCRMDPCAMPGRMGRGKCDQTRGASGRWQEKWHLAQRHEQKLSGKNGVWQTLGGGNLLQRTQTHHGLDVNFTQTKPTAQISSFPGVGLHPETVGAWKYYECFQQSKVLSILVEFSQLLNRIPASRLPGSPAR